MYVGMADLRIMQKRSNMTEEDIDYGVVNLIERKSRRRKARKNKKYLPKDYYAVRSKTPYKRNKKGCFDLDYEFQE